MADFDPIDGEQTVLHIAPIRAAFQRCMTIDVQATLEEPSPDGVLPSDGFDVRVFGEITKLKAAYPLDINLGDQYRLARHRPFVGRAREANPWRRLWFGDGPLAALVRAAIPGGYLDGAWVYPLNWPVATRITVEPGFLGTITALLDAADVGLNLSAYASGQVIVTPGPLREQLAKPDGKGRTPAELLDTVADLVTVSKVVGAVLSLVLGAVALVVGGVGIVARVVLSLLAGGFGATGGIVPDGLPGALRRLANALRTAIEPGTSYNTILAELIFRLDELFVLLGHDTNPLFGLEGEAVTEVIVSLGGALDDSAASMPPIVSLPDAALEFDFDGFEAIAYATAADTGAPLVGERAVYIHGAWLGRASPTLQFAATLELAETLLSCGIASESSWYAFTGLVASRGAVGRAIWGETRDLDRLSRMLDGLSLADLAAFVWKQGVADTFIRRSLLALPDTEPDCLFELFCWMSTPDDRAVLDAVLGPAAERLDADGLCWREGGGIFAALFEAPNATIPTSPRTLWGIGDRYYALKKTGQCCLWEKFIALVKRRCPTEAWFATETLGQERYLGPEWVRWEAKDLAIVDRFESTVRIEFLEFAVRWRPWTPSWVAWRPYPGAY